MHHNVSSVKQHVPSFQGSALYFLISLSDDFPSIFTSIWPLSFLIMWEFIKSSAFRPRVLQVLEERTFVIDTICRVRELDVVHWGQIRIPPVGIDASMLREPSKGSKTTTYWPSPNHTAESSSSEARAATFPLLFKAALIISFCLPDTCHLYHGKDSDREICK